ncbi:predicted protein [Cyanophage PSS2]|uniref:tail tape measure protein n=1 Tax=Cyanophage PSS2 TaxID=658401 RepID=UPI0001B04025|nr:tail tape measure protein [Cyanophage PSS2]ACT65641.1 tail tape measure protein [Cyanophage PSS2]ACY75782.1 predicted protein [Cyanophage PSS2]
MGWVNNATAKPILKIDNVDYSSTLMSFRVSDSSIVTGGIVSTTGTVTLREGRGTASLEDYSKEKFGRGKVVRLDLDIAGTISRHPRGTLLILDSGYSSEDRTITLDVGCLLTMYGLTDNIDNLTTHTDFELPDGAGFDELSRALQAENAFIFVNKDGVVEKRNFFGNDGQASLKDEAQWVSVRDQTALSASPLGIGNPVPDRIVIAYSWIVDGSTDPGSTDPSGNPVDEDTTESNYFLEHPANIYATSTLCQPTPSGGQQCATFVQQDAKRTYGVTKRSANQRFYGGPGGSTSTEVSVTEGPAVELNGSYFAEYYSWEVARAADDAAKKAVVPRGLDNITQDRREKTYEYGSAGEVLKTKEYHFRNILNAMTQQDWRASGNTPTNTATSPTSPATTVLRGFLTNTPDELFLSQVITTEWEYFDDRTVETTETITSTATCGKTGIYGKGGTRELLEIGAYENGVKTTEKRTSRGGLVNPDQTPRNPGGTPTITKTEVIHDDSSKYTPTSAGSIVQNYNVPFVVPGKTEAEARQMAVEYASTQRWALEGDAAGIRVAETMRSEVFGYFPGMPFSFYDPTEEKLVKLRMNATTWGVSNREALFSTDGVFIGVSNGTVTLGSNTTGTTTAPSVDTGSETNVDTGRGGVDATEVISIRLAVGDVFSTGNGDDGFGIIQTHDQPVELLGFFNVGIDVEGQKLSKEAELLALDGAGNLISGGDLLLESGEEVIDADLFDETVEPGPDAEFTITTGPQAPTSIFSVLTAARTPDQSFVVTRSAIPADQEFSVQTIQTFQVLKTDQTFAVRRGAQIPGTTFVVDAGPSAPTKTYAVTRSAIAADQTFSVVTTQDPFIVTTGVATPSKIFFTTTGTAPAPTPNQEFGVSVGGAGAPQPDAPTDTFQVTLGPAIYNVLYSVKTIDTLNVTTWEAPFNVTVGADTPDTTLSIEVGPQTPSQIFAVTRDAKVLSVTVGPTLPTQIFEVLTGTTLDVTVGASTPDTTFAVTVDV